MGTNSESRPQTLSAVVLTLTCLDASLLMIQLFQAAPIGSNSPMSEKTLSNLNGKEPKILEMATSKDILLKRKRKDLMFGFQLIVLLNLPPTVDTRLITWS